MSYAEAAAKGPSQLPEEVSLYQSTKLEMSSSNEIYQA
jgi:hypothetical protein